MSLLLSGLNPKYLDAIKKFRLIDDTFFNICFDGSVECMQLLLRILLQRDDIAVTEVVTQRSAHNLYGRSVRFDVIAVDSNGKIYNVEIQRADEGAWCLQRLRCLGATDGLLLLRPGQNALSRTRPAS